eukprot:1187948-Prorocentrum_minimum.AAC.3
MGPIWVRFGSDLDVRYYDLCNDVIVYLTTYNTCAMCMRSFVCLLIRTCRAPFSLAQRAQAPRDGPRQGRLVRCLRLKRGSRQIKAIGTAQCVRSDRQRSGRRSDAGD